MKLRSEDYTRVRASGESRIRLRLLLGAAALAVSLGAPARADVVDLHVHVAGLGEGGSGCFISEAMQESLRFPFYLRAFGVTRAELEVHGDALLVERLSERVARSSRVQRAVVLALDGVIDASGALDRERTQVYVPNDYVAQQAGRFGNLLFGASVHPRRSDALDRLEQAREQGAVLVKWIPSIMDIDPADPALADYYRKLVELGLPLLTHAGQERAFANARDELADPRRLELPLRLGVTVIAAHIATTGECDGEDCFERLLALFPEFPNLYADISSLTQINKLGYLVRALRAQGVTERLVYGSDWPLQFFPLISPWYHLRHIGLGGLYRVWGASGTWDRDVVLKRELGTPESVFLRGAELLARPAPGGGRRGSEEGD